MENRYLYKFCWDYGRMGCIEGLFVAMEDKVKSIIGKELFLGEALGKHSEVYGVLEEEHIEKINLDSTSVEKVAKHLGDTWSGYNPLEYVRIECEVCGDPTPMEYFNGSAKICSFCESKQV